MKISVLTLFPEIYTPFLGTSLIKKAVEKKLVSFDVTSYFSYVQPKEPLDAPTFGHGAGMLLKPLVVEKAIEDKDREHGKSFKIFLSPQGKKLDQSLLIDLGQKLQSEKHLMLISSRYEGMDSRLEDEYADIKISAGDFVVMGGDIPAMLFLEGFLRHIPGVIGRSSSVEEDSFTGPFVDHPEFTEPVIWHDKEVPPIVRSGNHAAIKKWQDEQAAQKTILHHFDWFRSSPMTDAQKKLGASCIPSHYVALMHTDVMVKDSTLDASLSPRMEREGVTSITSLDIHDIARSARTYGLKKYFIVSDLADQQKIAQKLLGFWKAEVGIDYNPERHEAVREVELAESLAAVIAQIEKIEGKKPLVIITSAQPTDTANLITYSDQEKVWTLGRPVLIVLGTGRGLAKKVIDQADFVLIPVKGFTEFNHLSVRSAAAVIFDRWLGWNQKRSG